MLSKLHILDFSKSDNFQVFFSWKICKIILKLSGILGGHLHQNIFILSTMALMLRCSYWIKLFNEYIFLVYDIISICCSLQLEYRLN